MRPREARVRDEAAEMRPARVFEIAIKRVEVADAVREDGDRVDARVAQVLLGAQLVADERARRGERFVVDQAFGCGVRDIDSFCGLVHVRVLRIVWCPRRSGEGRNFAAIVPGGHEAPAAAVG
jgi:hypothetical protein